MTGDRCTDETAQALLGLFALGRLGAAERAQALAHLERCTACRHEVEELSRVTSALNLLTPEEIAEILTEDETPPKQRGSVCLTVFGTRDRRRGHGSSAAAARSARARGQG